MRRLILTTALVVGLGTPAWADFEGGLVAYARGDYHRVAGAKAAGYKSRRVMIYCEDDVAHLSEDAVRAVLDTIEFVGR